MADTTKISDLPLGEVSELDFLVGYGPSDDGIAPTQSRRYPTTAFKGDIDQRAAEAAAATQGAIEASSGAVQAAGAANAAGTFAQTQGEAAQSATDILNGRLPDLEAALVEVDGILNEIDGTVALVAGYADSASDDADAARLSQNIAVAADASAQAARDEAEIAGVAALAATTYPDTATGLPPTAEGGFFWVGTTGDTILKLYRKVSDAAVFINDAPSSSFIKGLIVKTRRPGSFGGEASADGWIIQEYRTDGTIRGPGIETIAANAQAGANLASVIVRTRNVKYSGGDASADGWITGGFLRSNGDFKNSAVDKAVSDAAVALITAQTGGALAQTLGVAGNSLGDQMSADVRIFSRGVMNWLTLLTDACFEFRDEWNFGISGQTSLEIFARSDDFVNCPAVWWLIPPLNTNDFPSAKGISAAQSIATWDAFITKMRNAGKRLIMIAETPRGYDADTTYRLTDAERDKQFIVREHQLASARLPGVYIVDPARYLIDPTSPTASINPEKAPDGIHWIGYGSFDVAQGPAKILKNEMEPIPRLPISNANLYSATNPVGNRIANGMMAGTGGTKSGGSVGQVPDGWNAAAPAGLSVTWSKVILDDGTMSVEAFVDGTPASARIDLTAPVDVAGLAVNDTLSMVGGIEVDPNSGMWTAASLNFVVTFPTLPSITPSFGNESNNSGLPAITSGPNQRPAGPAQPKAGFKGTMPVPKLKLLEVPTAITAMASIVLKVGTPIQLRVRWHSIDIHKESAQ